MPTGRPRACNSVPQAPSVMSGPAAVHSRMRSIEAPFAQEMCPARVERRGLCCAGQLC